MEAERGRSVEPRDHQRLVAVWKPGSGIAVHNVKCGEFHLFVCFTTPYWSVLLRLLSWGVGGIHNRRFVAKPLELGLGTRSPCFVAWPVELGLGIRNARSTMINRSTVFALHCFVLPCVLIKMQGVGLLDFTLGYSTIGYFTFLFLTLPCPVLTYSS